MTLALTPMDLRLDAVLAEVRATTSRVVEASARFDAATRHAREVAALVRRDTAAIPKRTRAVLVVDDDDADRATLVDLLRTELPDVAVDGAESPTAANVYLRRTPYALVIVDYYLQDAVSGLEYVRSLGRGPRAAIVTGRADVTHLRALAQRLDVQVFTRPVRATDWRDFLDYVRDQIERATE